MQSTDPLSPCVFCLVTRKKITTKNQRNVDGWFGTEFESFSEINEQQKNLFKMSIFSFIKIIIHGTNQIEN